MDPGSAVVELLADVSLRSLGLAAAAWAAIGLAADPRRGGAARGLDPDDRGHAADGGSAAGASAPHAACLAARARGARGGNGHRRARPRGRRTSRRQPSPRRAPRPSTGGRRRPRFMAPACWCSRRCWWRATRFTRRLVRASRRVDCLGADDVFESDWIAVPMTVGLARPKILLPAGWREWPADKLDAAMAHERMHVRRADWAIAVLAGLNAVPVLVPSPGLVAAPAAGGPGGTGVRRRDAARTGPARVLRANLVGYDGGRAERTRPNGMGGHGHGENCRSAESDRANPG